MRFGRLALTTRSAPKLLLMALLAVSPALGQVKSTASGDQGRPALIWEDPGDIKAKDLFNGPGGEKRRPALPVKFLKEDKHGHNSKLDVEDANGGKWKAKLGIEAQPEVVATRLLWAIGYFTNENYFVRDLAVEGLPAHLKRGEGHVVAPGHLESVRLQRQPEHTKKVATWSWRHNPLVGTREFNGLRVMMALLSNWDLKDENNAILEGGDQGDKNKSEREEYLVSDVGTAFGASGEHWTEAASKNNLKEYQHARFIAKTTSQYVDFHFPRRPPLLHLLILPSYIHHACMGWVGNHVPRADAKWLGSLLAQLSAAQIEDAFRAGGYPPEKASAFTRVVQVRIAELNQL
jgi:hypothetical protein